MTDPGTSRVVITRPLAQAAPLAQRVAALGRQTVLFPLLEIHPLPDIAPLQAALNDLRSYAMAAFVSPNAIDATFAILRGWPREVPLAVMGEGSRIALARHGVTPDNAVIISPHDTDRTDSQTLLAALDVAALRGKRVLILRGETGRELLADALRGAGVAVTQVAAYRRSAPVLDPARRAELIGLLDSDNDWIVTSSEALQVLMRMVGEVGEAVGVAKMQQQRLIVPHVRIQETAAALGFARVTLTASGDEGLLAALQS
jgi:uroporphyrinogen-III synthase